MTGEDDDGALTDCRSDMTVVQRHRIDRVLDNFFTSRISLRFLVETYICSKKNEPGYSGVIESECSPVLVSPKNYASLVMEIRGESCRRAHGCGT